MAAKTNEYFKKSRRKVTWDCQGPCKHLPLESANLIRAKSTSILKNSKHSRHRNMTKDELETLKRLSKDTSVTILPADKGRAVVVMDSSDY